ncbi:MAG TPA: MarR family transcriptional regulator [Ktedonobacteraceae bacterium]|nr:MarR family transcriptional regulator [Ktedonobacteraceae bacterium]
MTLATLSRRIGFDKSWTSRAVENLVQEGLVEKTPSTQDRRTVQLSLSPAGEIRLTELNQTLNSLAERTFEQIPVEQHPLVRTALEWLQQSLLALTQEAWGSASEEGETPCGCDERA